MLVLDQVQPSLPPGNEHHSRMLPRCPGRRHKGLAPEIECCPWIIICGIALLSPIAGCRQFFFSCCVPWKLRCVPVSGSCFLLSPRCADIPAAKPLPSCFPILLVSCSLVYVVRREGYVRVHAEGVAEQFAQGERGRVLEIPPRTTPSPLHSSFSWLPPSRGVCACAPREAYLTITATLARAPRPRPFFCLWFPRTCPAAVTVHAAHNTRGQSDNRYSPSDAQIGFCILCGLCAPVYPERQDARRHEVLFHHRSALLRCPV